MMELQLLPSGGHIVGHVTPEKGGTNWPTKSIKNLGHGTPERGGRTDPLNPSANYSSKIHTFYQWYIFCLDFQPISDSSVAKVAVLQGTGSPH